MGLPLQFDKTQLPILMLKRFYLHKAENWFLLLALTLSLFIRLRHLDIAFERDEGEYAYAAQAILRGELPYQDFYNMKLPGVYYSYAVLFWLFGDSLPTVKIGLLFLNLFNTFLVFCIGKRLTDTTIAKFSAATYLLYSVCLSAEGFTANAEHFVLLPALLGTYTALRAIEQNTSIGASKAWLLASGICMASAFLCKQHAVFYVLFVPILLIINFLEKNLLKNLLKLPPQYFGQNLAFGIGIVLAFASMFGFIFSKGIYEPFRFFTRDYAQAYVSITKNPIQELDNFLPIFGDNFVLWLVGFGMFYTLFRQKKYTQENLILIAFFICTTACVFPGGYFRQHYFQLMFPAAALLTGLGLANLSGKNYADLLPEKWLKPFSNLRLSPQTAVLALSLVVFVAMSPNYFLLSSSREVLQRHYVGPHFSEMRSVGEYLEKITKPNDRVAVLANEPQVAFHTRRKLASGFLYMFPFFEPQRYAEQMQKQFVREIEASQPEILVYGCSIEYEDDGTPLSGYVEAWYTGYIRDFDIIGKVYQRGHYDAELRWKSASDDLSDDGNVAYYIMKRKTPPQ